MTVTLWCLHLFYGNTHDLQTWWKKFFFHDIRQLIEIHFQTDLTISATLHLTTAIRSECLFTVLQMYCGDGKTSSMATLWFSSPESTVKSLFHDSYGMRAIRLLLYFIRHNSYILNVFFAVSGACAPDDNVVSRFYSVDVYWSIVFIFYNFNHYRTRGWTLAIWNTCFTRYYYYC